LVFTKIIIQLAKVRIKFRSEYHFPGKRKKAGGAGYESCVPPAAGFVTERGHQAIRYQGDKSRPELETLLPITDSKDE